MEVRLAGSLVLVAALAQRDGHSIYESFSRSQSCDSPIMGVDRNPPFRLYEDRVSFLVRNLVCDNKESGQPNRLEPCGRGDERNINCSCRILHICRSLEHNSLDLKILILGHLVPGVSGANLAHETN